jgi:predicted NUDIX family NTP pyrophosphohydrolase
MKKSAGILPYRCIKGKLQFFLVHPGGPFWKNKDLGAWTIPKGEFDNEDALTAAKREFKEETGFDCEGIVTPLAPIKQKNGKLVYAWAVQMDIEADKINSNLFEMEWPPQSGNMQKFPEIDKAAWFAISVVLQKINPAQTGFIDEVVDKLNCL